MGKFDIFNKFNSAVAVVDETQNVVYRNNVFKRTFSDFIDLQKFSHKLNYSVCALISNDVEVHSPILQALKSPQDFSAHVLYQSAGNEYSYYDLVSSKKGKYTILVFTDVTAKIGLEKSITRNQNLQKKISLLEVDNKNLIKIKQQAQSQAMKLLLLNNISNIIRGSVDSSKILTSALDELSNLFAAFRAYYAIYSKDMNAYIVNESLHKKDISRKITFDKETEKAIEKGDVDVYFDYYNINNKEYKQTISTFIEDYVVIGKQEDNHVVTSFESLRGKKIAMIKDNSLYSYFKNRKSTWNII